MKKVADWFRQVFQLNHWTLESDVANADGSVSIMATKDDRPIWLTLHRNAGAEGTTYTLIGAIPADSAAVAESLARAKTRPPVPARKPGQVR